MHELKYSYQVVIAGGGPVGLYLAILLHQYNIDCVVLEKRSEPISHSRSLGIHPVSLELMQEIGLAKQFVEEGIKIEKGIAWCDQGTIGTLNFESCPKPYRFILSLPQYRTEYLLEQKLRQVAPNSLKRGAEVVQLEEYPKTVKVTIRDGNEYREISGDYLIGCDGKDSTVRGLAGFHFEGKRYPDTYVMGDFRDNTNLESTAVIFLSRDGLIESFPICGNRRRWVVKTDRYIENLDRHYIDEQIQDRIGYDIGDTQNYMLSSFGVQRYLAQPMAGGQVFLAGDAAHVVSPIGGQGMNLGWLDAKEIAVLLPGLLANEEHLPNKISNYSKQRTRVAQKVIRRAEINMALGRKSSFHFVKNSMVWLMLNTPMHNLMARLFTMRGIKNWPL